MKRLILCAIVVVCFGGQAETRAGIVGAVLQTYENPIPGDGDSFGTSIAAVGNDVLVGVGYHDITLDDDGAAYLFDGQTGVLQQTFNNPVPHDGDQFGRSVASMGNNLLVGAPSSVRAPDPTAGAAYLFDTAGTLLQTFNNPTPDPHDGFGASIAVAGDTVAISAPNDDTKAGASVNAGAVYLFDATGAFRKAVFSPVAAGGDYFGGSIAAVGDNILVGAGGSDQAAYLFDTSGSLLQTFENPMTPGDGHFGINVAAFGDDVLVDALDGEHAYLFDSETGDVLQTFHNPLPGETFGHAIAGFNGNVLVGAPSATMHMFDASSGDLLYTFDNPGGKIGAPIEIMGNSILTGDGETTYRFTIVPEPHPGDANFDMKTDLSDFNIWNANKFTAPTDWSTADFDGNGGTDLSDFNIWNAHKFTVATGGSAPAPTEVPEPGIRGLMIAAAVIGLIAFGLVWRQRPD